MIKKVVLGLIAISLQLFLVGGAHAFDGRNPEAHNMKAKSVLANGYDVVAYFSEFGGKPTQGLDEFALDYKDLTYKFSSQENLNEFLANPERYEPAHGGFCSYAMALGSANVDINPRSFIVKEERLFLFAPGTKSSWLQGDVLEQEEEADIVWSEESGEPARSPNY